MSNTVEILTMTREQYDAEIVRLSHAVEIHNDGLNDKNAQARWGTLQRAIHEFQP